MIIVEGITVLVLHPAIFSARREDCVGQTLVCAPASVGAPAEGRYRGPFAACRPVGQAILPAATFQAAQARRLASPASAHHISQCLSKTSGPIQAFHSSQGNSTSRRIIAEVNIH